MQNGTMTPRSLNSLLTLAAVLAAAPLTLHAEANHAKSPKPRHISQGEEVKLEDYLVPGKITVFDFYSEFCPPCRALGPKLESLHQARPDLAVVKVDINRPGIHGIDWKSPVSQEFALHSIPHLSVFGPDGKHQADLDGQEVWTAVEGWTQP